MNRRTRWLLAALVLAAGTALAAKLSDVRNTKHNLSSAGPGAVKAVSETQVCVFCHTPHAATAGVTPLWNRTLSNQTYTPYTSSSLDANSVQGSLDQPGGSSKLCLSCHDGTLAIGNVNVLNGAGSATSTGTQSISMSGTGTGGTMPTGSGETSGFTRKLGADLTNDHPISVTYNSTLASRDGELRSVDANQKWPADGSIVGIRSPGYKPKAPLEPTGASGAGQVQCASCHDPHIRETDAAKGNQKFLRLNRFQEATPTNNHDATNDIVCLACHDKNQGSGSWAYSAHANPLVATPTYTATAATQRDFPSSLPVWKAACLNCHDTHTVQGSRRLLREGTDSIASPKTGGASALEETCYQCHTASAAAAITPTTSVPNIKDDFALARRMPIASADQPLAAEAHDIGGNFSDATFVDCTTTTNKCGKDFIERRSKLGVGDANNRHAECTDCHNPHRVVKFRDFRGNPAGSLSGTPDAAGTHRHEETTGYIHSNVASGALRGAWGVEPIYTSSSFHSLPSGYTVKRGDPGTSTDDTTAAGHVTREYQICLKCHSDYGFSDDNVYPAGSRPTLGSFLGGTLSGTNGLTRYTNVAKESQAPSTHAGEPLSLGSDAGSADANFNNNNHRSWHPTMAATGRSVAARGLTSANGWRVPWNNANALGAQTLYCSDCHGSDTAEGTPLPSGGENGNPWGPHGSNNDFILKGVWGKDVGATGRDSGYTANMLCFKCHNPTTYTTRNDSGQTSGFYNSSRGNLHNYHIDKIQKLHCTWCHVAVPHGWKNKSLLVNLNDVGEEAGQGAGSSKEVSIAGSGDYYTQEPYYLEAKLKVYSFAASGNWSDTNCGSRGKSGTGLTTGRINSTNGQTNNTTGNGKNWMGTTCSNPP